jgi:hypothetical protein
VGRDDLTVMTVQIKANAMFIEGEDSLLIRTAFSIKQAAISVQTVISIKKTPWFLVR